MLVPSHPQVWETPSRAVEAGIPGTASQMYEEARRSDRYLPTLSARFDRAESEPLDPTTKAIPWWAVAAGIAAPVLLIGGFFVATEMQPASYNPVRDTISNLAESGATDSWLMTCALAGLGLCYLLAAVGLQPAGRFGRVLLAGGGVATLLIALFRTPRHGYSLAHELAVIAAALTCCTWPAFASHRMHPARLLTRAPSLAAAGASLVLAGWYALESHGTLLGLAERCAAAAPPLWLLAVVVTTRRALTQGAANSDPAAVEHAA